MVRHFGFAKKQEANCIRANFSTAEKTNYIAAVQCLMKLPSKTPKADCPGCRSRYDDFTANHIKQTFTVRRSIVGYTNNR